MLAHRGYIMLALTSFTYLTAEYLTAVYDDQLLVRHVRPHEILLR